MRRPLVEEDSTRQEGGGWGVLAEEFDISGLEPTFNQAERWLHDSVSDAGI